ncbi:hypothetical protein IscW_ISCW006492, partial [Ixodes scapularis]
FRTDVCRLGCVLPPPSLLVVVPAASSSRKQTAAPPLRARSVYRAVAPAVLRRLLRPVDACSPTTSSFS